MGFLITCCSCIYCSGHMSILKLLVRRYGKDIVEKQDKNSTKPVYFASQEGDMIIHHIHYNNTTHSDC